MTRLILLIFLIMTCSSCVVKNEMRQGSEPVVFNLRKDFLLLNYDCKTDVDDLHSIAAAASLIRIPRFAKLNYHAVAGTYGIQDGEYVPANSLFSLAFNDRWSDAHKDYDNSLIEVYSKVSKVLNNGGNIWIAEAGQSDFSSDLVRKIQEKMSRVHTTERIVVVQHSEWNEEMSRKENLSFLKKNSKYHKIPDGNVLHNGTPGYSTSDHVDWMSALEDEENLAIWKLATSLADTYNGYQGRYLNKAVKAGGLDFSDFCEVHQILNLDKIDSCMDYFEFIKINTDN